MHQPAQPRPFPGRAGNVAVLLQGRMQSANIGDSGYVVLGTTPQKRDFHVKYHTPQQEHSFGCPYQLGHGDNADHPDSAMLASLPVRSAFTAPCI